MTQQSWSCSKGFLASAMTHRTGSAHTAGNAMIGTEARVRPGINNTWGPNTWEADTWEALTRTT